MNISDKGKALIATFESCRLKAYLCPAGLATIGYGNTRYEDGTPVQLGHTITQTRAEQLFSYILNDFEAGVLSLVKSNLTQHQFDALVSFAYNVGVGNLGKSTLLKKVNKDPNDISIGAEFLKWNKSGGKILKGLTRRRQAETELYFQVLLQ